MKNNYFFLLIIGIVIVFYGSACQQKYGDKEIYLIPEGFTGKVYVLYERKDGTEIAYEDGYRVYKVPKNGIVKTTFNQNLGLFPHDSLYNWFQFYYKDSISGERIRIPNFYYRNNMSENHDSVYVFFPLEGTMEINNQPLKIFFIDSLKKKESYRLRPVPDSIINEHW